MVKSIDRYRTMPGASTSWDTWTDRYEAPDARTFTEITKKPYGYFLMDLGSPLTAIMAMETIDQFGDLKTHVAGSGPYTLKSYDPNVSLEMVRNPTYYQQYPYVDGFSVKVYTDDASAQAAFRAGQIDAYNATTKPKADNVGSVSGVTVQKFLDRTYTVFMMNAVQEPKFKDERIREAVDLALDRKQMIDKLCFGDGVQAGPVPPLWPAALPQDEVDKAYTRDVAKAKQLLSAAGASDLTFDLSFGGYADNPDRAAIIKSNLADAGITANLKSADVGTWLNNLTNNNFVSHHVRPPAIPFGLHPDQLAAQPRLGPNRHRLHRRGRPGNGRADLADRRDDQRPGAGSSWSRTCSAGCLRGTDLR